MTVRKILFATDFSQASERAQKLAGSMQEQMGCELVVLHAYDPQSLVLPVPYGTLPGAEQWVDEHFTGMREQGRQALNDLCPDLGADSKSAFVEGKPGPSIVKYAKENDVDLIVMGTHGCRGLERLVMGSVAEYVVRHASCPVISVKNEETELVD